MSLRLFSHCAGDKISSNHAVETGNRGVSRSPRRRLIRLPLNPGECGLAGATVVCLVPSRTGTAWWHAWVLEKAEIRHRKGRITFVGAANPAGFDSVAAIYRPRLF